MTTEADQVIRALHTGVEQLAPVVRALTLDQLTGPSAAAEWDVSQVLSHLGSGAVIALAGLEAALSGSANPGMEANQAIWARWNAMGAQERADACLTANTALLDRYDSLGPQTRQDLRIDLGFLPAPVDLATAGRFRLNEFTLHSWDVRVAPDPTAVLHSDAVPLLLNQVGFMLGWLAKSEPLQGRTVQVLVTLLDLDTSFGLTLGDSPSLGAASRDPDATLTIPAEAWLRLASGRLAAEHTPAAVALQGELSLDTLRAVFPGY
jgi:uncharacterized protein (TIGR03083 family)